MESWARDLVEMRVAVVTVKLESGWLHGGTRQLRSGNTEWDQSQNPMPPQEDTALALALGRREYSGERGRR